MGLFPNVNNQYTFGGKTHTNLIVSEGVAPAEKFIVSKTNPAEVFTYEFGPEGAQQVVLAKGKIVEVAGVEYDQETGKRWTAVKQADVNSKRAFGINHHNVYKKRRDGLNGGDATIVTKSYIEVPLFEATGGLDSAANVAVASNAAKAMRYGAAYGESNIIKPGDYVKVGENGNFVKLDESVDSPFEIVGQALAVERDLPPAGFLQYYSELINPEIEAVLKQMSYAPSPGNNGQDAGAYPYGYPYRNRGWLPDFEQMLMGGKGYLKGVPFLTDGFFKAQEKKTFIINEMYSKVANTGHVESVVVTDGLTLVNGKDVAVGAEVRNAAAFIKLHHPIDKTFAKEDQIVVTYKDANAAGAVKTLASEDVFIDYTNNTVVLYLEAGMSLQDITITAQLVVDPTVGIPTEWDYAGSVGAVRILLG
jgi:hypothetical protein